MPYANNKDADQPAHLRSLISAFVFCCLDSIIPLISISEISSMYLASVAAQTSLCLTLYCQGFCTMVSRFLYKVYYPLIYTWLTMYYIRPLLYNIKVSIQFSQGLSMNCIGFNTECICAVTITVIQSKSDGHQYI